MFFFYIITDERYNSTLNCKHYFRIVGKHHKANWNSFHSKNVNILLDQDHSDKTVSVNVLTISFYQLNEFLAN